MMATESDSGWLNRYTACNTWWKTSHILRSVYLYCSVRTFRSPRSYDLQSIMVTASHFHPRETHDSDTYTTVDYNLYSFDYDQRQSYAVHSSLMDISFNDLHLTRCNTDQLPMSTPKGVPDVGLSGMQGYSQLAEYIKWAPWCMYTCLCLPPREFPTSNDPISDLPGESKMEPHDAKCRSASDDLLTSTPMYEDSS